MKKIFTLLLSAIMLVGSIGITAFADVNDTISGEAVTSVSEEVVQANNHTNPPTIRLYNPTFRGATSYYSEELSYHTEFSCTGQWYIGESMTKSVFWAGKKTEEVNGRKETVIRFTAREKAVAGSYDTLALALYSYDFGTKKSIPVRIVLVKVVNTKVVSNNGQQCAQGTKLTVTPIKMYYVANEDSDLFIEQSLKKQNAQGFYALNGEKTIRNKNEMKSIFKKYGIKETLPASATNPMIATEIIETQESAPSNYDTVYVRNSDGTKMVVVDSSWVSVPEVKLLYGLNGTSPLNILVHNEGNDVWRIGRTYRGNLGSPNVIWARNTREDGYNLIEVYQTGDGKTVLPLFLYRLNKKTGKYVATYVLLFEIETYKGTPGSATNSGSKAMKIQAKESYLPAGYTIPTYKLAGKTAVFTPGAMVKTIFTEATMRAICELYGEPYMY